MPKVVIIDDESGDELESWYVSSIPRAGEYVIARSENHERRVLRVIHEHHRVTVVTR